MEANSASRLRLDQLDGGGNEMGYYIYLDPQEYWRWYLLGAGHRRIAESSEGYHDRQDCRDAIAIVKGSATVPVHEV